MKTQIELLIEKVSDLTERVKELEEAIGNALAHGQVVGEAKIALRAALETKP